MKSGLRWVPFGLLTFVLTWFVGSGFVRMLNASIFANKYTDIAAVTKMDNDAPISGFHAWSIAADQIADVYAYVTCGFALIFIMLLWIIVRLMKTSGRKTQTR